jgi:hypothetical protein
MTENRVKSTFRLSKDATEALAARAREFNLNQTAALEALLLSGGESADLPLANSTSEKGSNLSAEAVEGWVSTIGAHWGSLMALEDKKSSVLRMLEERAEKEERFLLEHQQHLSEVMLTAEKATLDLKGMADSVEIKRVRDDLLRFSGELASLKIEQRQVLGSAVKEIERQTREHLDRVKTVIERSAEEIEKFEQQYSAHQKEISAVVDRVQKGLKLTPTVALSVVLVGCSLAVLTSLFFLPTFEKFKSDVLIEQTVTPVIRSEIQSAFAKMRDENQSSLKSFYDSEQDRFEKFAQKYRGRIDVLSDEKVALQRELQRVTQIANSNSSYASNLEKEIKRLNSKSSCGVISEAEFGSEKSSENGSKVGFALLVSPLLFAILSVLKNQKFQKLTSKRLA